VSDKVINKKVINIYMYPNPTLTIFINMKYLKYFKTDVSPSDNGYRVTYIHEEYSGTVDYVKYELNTRLMKGKDVYLMVNSDMGDIIEIIHQHKPLTSEDHNDLNMEIRQHSRQVLHDFTSLMGKGL
jgi:hypothetical protein